MIFLSCNGQAVIKLELKFAFQDQKGKVFNTDIEVSPDKVYRVVAADNTAGIVTYIGRIVAFTMCPETETLSFVNNNTKPTVVDTITMDCSKDNKSERVILNIGDLRAIEELSTSGFDEIVNREVPTFR